MFILIAMLITLTANIAARTWLERLHGKPVEAEWRRPSALRISINAVVTYSSILVLLFGPFVAAFVISAMLATYLAYFEAHRLLFLGMRRSPLFVQLAIIMLWLLQMTGFTSGLINFVVYRPPSMVEIGDKATRFLLGIL